MISFRKIKIIDCTLRDGGYYNNWHFKKDLINEYLKVMDIIKVDYVEIGFRLEIKEILKVHAHILMKIF